MNLGKASNMIKALSFLSSLDHSVRDWICRKHCLVSSCELHAVAKTTASSLVIELLPSMPEYLGSRLNIAKRENALLTFQ